MIVMLHGLSGSGACWTPVARELEGFEVVLPDARDHATYDALADDVEPLLRSPTILVGHSMGGLTAAVVASRRPAMLRGLVLVDPTFLSPERQREANAQRPPTGLTKEALLADMRKRHPHRSEEMRELLADARAKTSAAAWDILTPPNPDYRSAMRAVAVPTLLVIGDHTIVTREMANEIRGENDRVQIAHVDGAGHGLPYDQPARVGQIIRELVLTLP